VRIVLSWRHRGWQLAGALVALCWLSGCQPGLIATPTPVVVAGLPEEEAAVALVAPVPLAEALPPVALAIPDLGLRLAVRPMGWVVDEVGGQRTTRWEVPEEGAGWHITSAGAGGAGRTVLSGHQVGGDAPFAALAQGQLQAGQTLLLTDSAGVVFVYRIIEVSTPVPLTGASPADEALAASYLAPTSQPLLTLITGWPDFTTTHRLFVVAELAGVQAP
jgi:sortase A